MKISEHGKQRPDTLYIEDKSLKLKISIIHLLKACWSWQFKQLQNTARQHWSALYNIVLSENKNNFTEKPCFSILDHQNLRIVPRIFQTRSLHLETRIVQALRREDRVSSFELQMSTYFCWYSRLRWLAWTLARKAGELLLKVTFPLRKSASPTTIQDFFKPSVQKHGSFTYRKRLQSSLWSGYFIEH